MSTVMVAPVFRHFMQRASSAALENATENRAFALAHSPSVASTSSVAPTYAHPQTVCNCPKRLDTVEISQAALDTEITKMSEIVRNVRALDRIEKSKPTTSDQPSTSANMLPTAIQSRTRVIESLEQELEFKKKQNAKRQKRLEKLRKQVTRLREEIRLHDIEKKNRQGGKL